MELPLPEFIWKLTFSPLLFYSKVVEIHVIEASKMRINVNIISPGTQNMNEVCSLRKLLANKNQILMLGLRKARE